MNCHVGNDTTVRLHVPRLRRLPSPALLWIHGGGFTAGSAALDDPVCRHLARTLGILVAAVDYRLAPEHLFPAATEDCYRAMSWLADQQAVDRSAIVAAGEGAGGALTSALAHLVRDRGEPALVHQALVAPLLAVPVPAPGSLLTADGWHDRTSCAATLGGAADSMTTIAGLLPPTGVASAWIGVGENDSRLPAAIDHADRLRAHGVDCVVDVVAGAGRDFLHTVPNSDLSRRFLARYCSVLRRVFDG